MTNRREFLQSTAAITGSFILPTILVAKPSSNFHFIHADSCKHWPVNPVSWSLQYAHDPILARAADGLGTLTPDDGDRIVKLVLRRCSLNLLEVHEHKVQVQFWGTNGQADLRPFFKVHQLASPDVQVTLLDRKKETLTHKTGDGFLFGKPIAHDFPIELFTSKWSCRFQIESDDHQQAPMTKSGFAWDGLEDGQIPWIALKSAWQRSQPTACLNCDQPTILVNFGLKQAGVFNRTPNFVSVCTQCQRSFVDDSIRDVDGWMAANLKTGFCPVSELVWGKRVEAGYVGI